MTKNEKENKSQPEFQIIHQYLKDLSFENLLDPKAILNSKVNPHGEVSLNIMNTEVDQKHKEINLQFTINANDPGTKKNIYIIEVTYSCIIKVSGFSEDDVEKIVAIETPRLLFPYVRSIVSDATLNGGFAPLVMAPIDFFGLWLNQKSREAEELTKEAEGELKKNKT